MQRVPQRKKWVPRLDKWSAQLMAGLLILGLLIVLADVGLVAAIVLQNRGVPLSWLFAPKAVSDPEPTIWISPTSGEPGTAIRVMGKGWQAQDSLAVLLEDPWGMTCPGGTVATTQATEEGELNALVMYPASGCWAGLARAQIAVRSLQTDTRAAAGFQVLAVAHTPTPTGLPPVTTGPSPTGEPTSTLPVVPVTIAPTQTTVLTATPAPTTAPTATPTPTPSVTPTFTPVPTATPTATLTPTLLPAIVDWRGEYFDNVSLAGDAKLVRNDRGPGGTLGLDFDWGQGVPASDLPADGFSARWTRTLNFEQGRYRFSTTVDDGMRLFIDGELVIDEWRDGSPRQAAAERWLAAGRHSLRVEYYERSGLAVARLIWEKIASFPDWKGEYWPNLSLSGNSALVRNDTSIAFDWGQSSPSSVLPIDQFSARWTRQVAFEGGTYRFHTLVDDGVRMWVDDRLIIDGWSDHNGVELTADYALAKGTYALKVEYYERVGNARIQVWWEATTPSYPDWKGEYWPNRDLSGPVALVRNDKEVNFDWGPNAPASALPADNFSARWTRKTQFDAATYRFHALADDGVRLWVDGVLLIDRWQDQEPREWTADRTMVAGKRTIVVEYYEHTGGARVKLWWEKLASSFPEWKGEYWSNRDLSGAPALVRNDKDAKGELGLRFDWGTGAPAAGLPTDDFSARWTRQVTFEPGLYRLQARADDGIRVYVDGRLVLDEWRYRDQTYNAELSLGGVHQLEVRYFERGGDAKVRFSWGRIADPPPPVPLPSVNYSQATYNVDEDAHVATIAVLLNRAYDRPVSVNYATVDGTASAGSDYVAQAGRLTFDPGVTSQAFAVGILDDKEDEANETVRLVLSSPSNAALGPTSQATLVILDNDEPPLPVPYVQFSDATYSVDEGLGIAMVSVQLSRASALEVTVSYDTTGGTADLGSDYASVQGTLVFEPGETEQAIIVHILDDQRDEEEETIVVRITGAKNALLGDRVQATLVIVDNDAIVPPWPPSGNVPQ